MRQNMFQKAACDGKETFDRATANRVAREHNASRNVRKHRKRVATAFECPYCGHWHIGTNKTPTRRPQCRPMTEE